MSFFLRIFAHKWINVSWFVLILHCCNNAKLEIFILRAKETWHVTMGWITFCILGAEFLILFFLSLSFSRSQVVNFFRWQLHYLSGNIIIWVKTSSFVTQMTIFSNNPSFWKKNGGILMTWERENESERKKETQIPRLNIRSIW